MADNVEPGYIQSLSGKYTRKAENFNYMGSRIGSTKEDIQVQKSQARAACHKLQKVWTSDLDRNIKIRLFIAMVELVLLYGMETWSNDKDADQENRWHLYKDASDGSEYQLEEAHDKQGAIWRPAQSQFQNWH